MSKISEILQLQLDISRELSNYCTYLQINPMLQVPNYSKLFCCNENDRKIITRYRMGCNKLKLQTGRYSGSERNERLCICQNNIQSLTHVLFDCPFTDDVRGIINEVNISELFASNDFIRIAAALKAVEKILKITDE